MTNPKTIMIDDQEYVRKEDIAEKAGKLDGMDYVIIRTYSAGVFAGYLYTRDGKEVELKQARRIHYWDGAASLSQLAEEGTSKPENCRFPQEIQNIILTEAIEIINCTEKSKKSIASVKIWKE